MRRAGCTGLNLGAESGSDRILQVLAKGETTDVVRNAVKQIQAEGMAVTLSFILGNPDETEAEMLQTLAFAQQLAPLMVQVAFLTPYPGSKLYENPSGLSISSCAQYDRLCCNLSQVPDQRLVRLQRLFYRHFYLSPAAIWRYLTRRVPYAITDRKEWRLLWRTLAYLGRRDHGR
jgi:radical SAM superfamily enzyme YgiQ (UPF0313 family)